MIRRSKPLARSTKPIPRKRSKPRRGPMRDRGYLDWLKSECKCLACSIRGLGNVDRDSTWKWRTIDPMHGKPNGRGSKGPDNEAIPGCRAHHDEQTAIGVDAFERKYGFDWKREAAAHYQTYLIWKEAQSA